MNNHDLFLTPDVPPANVDNYDPREVLTEEAPEPDVFLQGLGNQPANVDNYDPREVLTEEAPEPDVFLQGLDNQPADIG